MAIRTVGLLSPGEMGHAIGGVLHSNGVRVLSYLGERSQRTRDLAQKAGIEDTGSLDDLVERADILLCVLVPARATQVAEQVAASIERTGADLLYVDCNAIAPGTVGRIGATILAAGGRFADVGIIGPPPTQPGNRLYTSGPGATELAHLNDVGLDVRVIGDVIGQASGLKMCYAALTKGLQALGTELLIAAQLMGLEESLRSEQAESIPDVLGWLKKGVPAMPPKAHRWVGEMEEIATTFDELGLTPRILLGAADMYRFVAETPLGKESPESRDKTRDMDGVVRALAETLREPAATSIT